MIAPAFLFMVGIAIPFSLNSRSQRGASRGKLAWGILRRSILLFLLGLALNELPVFHWHTLHYNGILQLVARSYFVGATLYLAALDMKPTTRAAVIAVVAFAALGAYAALLKRDTFIMLRERIDIDYTRYCLDARFGRLRLLRQPRGWHPAIRIGICQPYAGWRLRPTLQGDFSG